MRLRFGFFFPFSTLIKRIVVDDKESETNAKSDTIPATTLKSPKSDTPRASKASLDVYKPKTIFSINCPYTTKVFLAIRLLAEELLKSTKK